MYSNPPFPDEDPELDVEAQFANHIVRGAQKRIEKKRRLQCVSGWLWCKYHVTITCTVKASCPGSNYAGEGTCMRLVQCKL